MSQKPRLNVLPSGGKAEQLRTELTGQPTGASAGVEITGGEAGLADRIVETLRTVYDPEIPVNIYDLGLIYRISITPVSAVQVRMTLTAPGCPVAGTLPGEIQRKIAAVEGVTSAAVELVWDPPWTRDRMTDEARLALGIL